MNFKYLFPSTIASHAAVLVLVLSQLITVETLTSIQHYCVSLIGLALPTLMLAFVLSPTPIPSKISQKWYLRIFPVAHLLGFSALTMLFLSFSKLAGAAFGLSSLVCLLVLSIFQFRSIRSPGVSEAYARANKKA